jgi:cation diffusion facilitator family transporter
MEAFLPDNSKIKERAALVSIGVKVFLAAGKLVAGLLSGSLALLSEAANNLGDIAIVLFSFIAIKIANKPADADHPYGHAKVESLAALIETGFLFALTIYISAEAIKRLTGHEEIEVVPSTLSFGVLIVSIVVDSARWYSLNRIAKATRSEALAADALNFASDIVAATLAMLGLIAVHFGYPLGDPLAALGVAIFIGIAGVGLGQRTINSLIDAAPPGLTDQIKAIASSVPGVISVNSLRLRPAGAEVLGDVSFAVARTLPLERVIMIKEQIRAAVTDRHPEVSMTITPHPIALDNETVLERVLLIAAKRHVPVHHIIVQEIDGRTSVSFDVEIDSQMPHGQAHEIVSGLELDVRKELGFEIEVDTHMEPLEPHELPGYDAAPDVRAEIAAALVKRAACVGMITDVHNVRVRETPAGLVVNYHCRVDPNLSVENVHDHVDDLDHMAQQDFPEIVRIVGHAEPIEI